MLSKKERFHQNKYASLLPLVYLISFIPTFFRACCQVYFYDPANILRQILTTFSIPYYLLSMPITIPTFLVLRCPSQSLNEACLQASNNLPSFSLIFYLTAGVAADYYLRKVKWQRKKIGSKN